MLNFLPTTSMGKYGLLALLFLLGLGNTAWSQSFSGLPVVACTSDGSVTLSGSTTGTFSGPGVTGNTFDPAVAGPGTHTVTFTPPRYRVETRSFVASSGAGTTISLGDDAVSSALNIGFTFDFFDNNFTQLFASSNGFLTFSTGQPNGCCSGQLLPNAAAPNNLIAFAWEDLDPGNGLGGAGNNRIWYQTIGTAPNRQFRYNFRRIDHFTAGNNVTGMVILYETSNNIEVHLASMPSDGGLHTEGIENTTGTVAFPVAGRNAANWSATNSSHRWVPQLPVTQVITVLAHNSQVTCPANITVNNDAGNCSAAVTYTTPTVTDECLTSLFDAFTLGTNPSLWDTIISGTNATSCGSVSGNALYFNGAGSREAITNDFNTSAGGEINFFLQIGTGVSPCEDADAGEEVVLEYSLNGGGLWTNIATYSTTAFPVPTQVAEPIPAAARTTSTRFRWRQLNNSGANFDNWSIDNVIVPLTALIDNFTTATNPSIWQNITNGTVANSCASPNGNHLYFNGVARSATTFDLNTTGGGDITFNLNFGTGATPCENADPGEDVVLEYSTNQGGTFTSLATFGTEVFINWNAATITIPVAAQTTSTRFRWRQVSNSGNNFDNWGMDNLVIPAAPIPTQIAGLPSGGTFPVGSTDNTYQYFDAGGDSAQCTFSVTVNDAEAPVALCQNTTVALNGSGAASITAGDINNGSADNCGIASISVSPSSFNCSQLGSNSVTLTVTDSAGNSDTCAAAVTVEDNIAPTAVCQNATIQLNGSGTATLTPAAVNGGSTDNCTISGATVSPSTFTCTNTGTNTVTLTVTDGSSNSDNCTATVTVEDNVAPTAVCQNATVQLDGSGNATVSTASINGGSTDNCGIASQVASPSAFTCANIGSNTVTLLVSDASSNVDTCSTNVTVEDNIAPSAVCQNVTVSLDSSGNGSTSSGALDGGSTDNCSVASVSASQTSFDCSNSGANNVTLTVTDGVGNTSTCTAVVTVEENIAPVAVCQGDTLQLDSNGTVVINASDLDGGSSDNCSVASLSVSPSNLTCADLGNTNVILTVSDPSGNSDNCAAIIFVEDVTPPVANCQNTTIQVDSNGIANLSASDVDGGSADNCGIVSQTVNPNSFFCFDLGVNSVTLTLTDGSGNVSTCNSQVTVVDNTAPVALCQNTTVQLDSAGNGSITASDVNGGSSDNCGFPSTSASPTSFSCFDLGTTSTQLVVTDISGNTDSCTATVIVVDNMAPVAVCQTVTVALDTSGTGNITASDIDGGSNDNCSIDSLVAFPNTFSCGDVGNLSVLLTVSDGSGNIDTCFTNVTVIDTVNPDASCQNVTVQLNSSGTATITVSDIDNNSNDVCGLSSLTADTTSFSCADLGTNQVVLTAQDVNGNSSTCTAIVTIEDTTAPLAICQNISVYLDSMGNAGIAAGDLDAGSMDACGVDTLVASMTQFGCSNVTAPANVSLVVLDASGNADTCSALVIVIDTIAPTLVCPANATFPNDSGMCSAAIAYLPPTFMDNCAGGLIITQTDSSGLSSGSNFPVGTTTQTYTATDSAGNSDSCSFDLTITDNDAPAITCPSVTSTSNDSGLCEALVTIPLPTATDNCTIDSLINSFNGSDNATDSYPVGNTTVLYTAIDPSGNIDTCTFIVSVLDGENPQLVCPADTTVLADSANCASSVTWSMPSAFDNCGIDTLFSSMANGSSFPVGTSTVTYTAVDVNGLSDSCDFDITVNASALTASITAQTYSCGTGVSCFGAVDGEATANPTGGCAPYSYMWSNGGMTATIGNLAAGIYVVTVSDSLGTMVTDSIEITEPDPIAIVATGNFLVCDGDSVGEIDLTISGGNDCAGGYTIQWSNGATTEDIAGLAPGIYSVTVSDISGCTASDTFEVEASPAPTPTVFKQNDSLFVNGTFQSYQWNRDGNLISGATFAFYIPQQSGSFSVTVIDSNGCEGTSDTLFCQIVSAEAPVGELLGIEIFPNPTSGILNVRSLKPIDKKVELTVMDIYGHIAKQYNLNGLRDTRELDLTDIANGMYILKVTDEKGRTASVRFMIE